MQKKILGIAGLAVLVLLQAAVAWNARLCWRASAVETDPEARIRLLDRAGAVYPWNPDVSVELGRVLFAGATDALGDPARRDALLDRAARSFLRALRLDPASAAAHFELAQTLLYQSYLGRPSPLAYFDEYKRAAELTGHNSRIRYDVGKVLLGRAEALTASEKDFVVEILHGALTGKGGERLPDLLETWNLAGRDYALIDRILPEDAAALRTYALFLGERALSLEARHTALTRAEALDVATARTELDRGRRDAESFMTADSSERCRAALRALASVRFYQNLAGRELFDPKEYAAIRKAARRLLAQNRIEETRSLDDGDGTIAAYLDLEDDFTALGEFETFLKERGLLDEAGVDSPLKDLKTLVFRMTLDFKLNRYRDIARMGDIISSSSLVITPSGRPVYARILSLIGESDLKLDSVYEAEKYFRMALEARPDDLGILLGLERCYARLNDEAKAVEVRRAVDRLISPPDIDLSGRLAGKAEPFETALETTGGPRAFRLEFNQAAPGRAPLVGIFVDDRVVWEKNGDTGLAEFSATLEPGRVSLTVRPVGGTVRLKQLSVAGVGPR